VQVKRNLDAAVSGRGAPARAAEFDVLEQVTAISCRDGRFTRHLNYLLGWTLENGRWRFDVDSTLPQEFCGFKAKKPTGKPET
jgi:hypothetical protein